MIYNYDITGIYHLVGGIPTPLKKMSSSVGMMTFPTEWKVIKFHASKPPTSSYAMGKSMVSCRFFPSTNPLIKPIQ